MLVNDFYSCRDAVCSDHEYSCRVVFNSEHAIFKGHFPGEPVVPGVCMMEIVKEQLQQQLNKKLSMQLAGNVKFLQFITPGVEPLLSISWKDIEGGYKINASFKSDSAFFFKLDGTYNPVSA